MRRRGAAALACVAAIAAPNTLHADRIRDDQWHLRFLNTSEAHKHSQGEGVVVAVIDTGVDPHPDLKSNLLPGTDVMSGSGDGQVDTDSHGTGMAGLIAAHGSGPHDGALGIAPRAKILPLRDRGPSEQGSSDALAAGIEWATQHDAAVISVSSAGGPSPRLRSAIAAAVAADVVVVAAAGNRPADLGVTFPAAFDGVLAVGATDREGNHADISVTGDQLAITAPGVDIFSTSVRGKYSKSTGTSASTAIVAGAVALVRSKYPELSAQEVIHRLTATATDKGPPGRDEEYGYGVLNLVAALTAGVPPLGAPSTPAASPPASDSDQDNGVVLLIVFAAFVAAAIVFTIVLTRARRASASGDRGEKSPRQG